MRLAIITLATCAASLGFTASAEAAECGWYAIYACDKSPNVDGPGYTVSTNGYPNFRKGIYCNLGGPFKKRADAMTQVRRFGGYAKRAC